MSAFQVVCLVGEVIAFGVTVVAAFMTRRERRRATAAAVAAHANNARAQAAAARSVAAAAELAAIVARMPKAEAGQLYIVGEEGPELVFPDRDDGTPCAAPSRSS